jgi:hypothetical protein
MKSRTVVAVVFLSLALGLIGIWRGVQRRQQQGTGSIPWHHRRLAPAPAPAPAKVVAAPAPPPGCKDYTITGSAYWKDFCPPVKYTMDFTMIGDEAVIKCRCKRP